MRRFTTPALILGLALVSQSEAASKSKYQPATPSYHYTPAPGGTGAYHYQQPPAATPRPVAPYQQPYQQPYRVNPYQPWGTGSYGQPATPHPGAYPAPYMTPPGYGSGGHSR